MYVWAVYYRGCFLNVSSSTANHYRRSPSYPPIFDHRRLLKLEGGCDRWRNVKKNHCPWSFENAVGECLTLPLKAQRGQTATLYRMRSALHEYREPELVPILRFQTLYWGSHGIRPNNRIYRKGNSNIDPSRRLRAKIAGPDPVYFGLRYDQAKGRCRGILKWMLL